MISKDTDLRFQKEPTKGTELTAPTTTEANQMATIAPPP